jgi:hypothetical protein
MVSANSQTRQPAAGLGNTPLNKQIPFHRPFAKDLPKPNSPEVSVDWLSFSFKVSAASDVERVRDYLSHTVQDEFVMTPGRVAPVVNGVLFQNTGRSTRGVFLKWNLPGQSKNGIGSMLVQIGGSALSPLSFLERIDLIMTMLSEPESKLTRIDSALDDYQYTVKFQDLQDAQSTDNFSGFNLSGISLSKKRGCEPGRTYYFGSRKSSRYLRVYDKGIESNGEKLCMRWELESKQTAAQQIGRLIYDYVGYNEEQLKKLLLDLIIGSINFIDRNPNSSNLDRMKRLSWWQQFIDYISAVPLRIPPPKPERSLQKSQNWLYNQVSSTIAMVKHVYGPERFLQIIDELVEDGLTKFTDYHRAQVTQAKNILSLAT